MRRLLLLLLLALVLTGATRTLNGGCSFVFGSDDASAALTDANLGPQGKLCRVPDTPAGGLVEISINADNGTPAVIVQRYRPSGGTTVDLTSTQLATGASGALACKRVSASTSIDGITACTSGLQNTTLQRGDWIQTKANTGGAGGVAKRVAVSIVWTW